MVTIHEAGFQTVAIFMQSGELEKKEPATNALSDDVEDSSNKVEIDALNLFVWQSVKKIILKMNVEYL